MKAKELTNLKKKLLNERARLLNTATNSRRQDFAIATDDLADEADLTSVERSQGIVFTLREKEQKVLAEIDEALQRMEEGAYGLCEECGDEISTKRLEIFPTARLCITHQEEEEKKRKFYAA
ncbi:MAG: TraR/DksA family transcriptional regulator [Oligoflexia bacterium]|nr:TraR/DksA family transcriptional regulator [Oligoflexia bacterium]